jgi:hypothetical protein
MGQTRKKNNLNTIGATQTSIAQRKFGATSIQLNGTTDYINILGASAGSNYNFGSGNFTIELWYYKVAQAPASCRLFQIFIQSSTLLMPSAGIS